MKSTARKFEQASMHSKFTHHLLYNEKMLIGRSSKDKNMIQEQGSGKHL